MRLACPAAAGSSLPNAVLTAVDHAIDLELHASRDPQSAVATNLLFTDPAKVRAALGPVPLAAVWMAVPLAAPAMTVDELARVAAAAATAGCGVVVLTESRPTPAAVLRSAGHAAAAAGVVLALVNPPGRNGIVALWRRLDAVDHPAVAASLDTGRAAAGGDGPSLSVPTLGSRIVHVRLAHPPTDADAVHRLAGIGVPGAAVGAFSRGSRDGPPVAAGAAGRRYARPSMTRFHRSGTSA